MAEIVYKSPGVFTREIDNSQPSETAAALSTPAGVIGTAKFGPAYVPVTITSINQLESVFGRIDGSSYGRLAAAQYLKNGGGSIAYVRILGIGNGKARNANGSVTNAGFYVGSELIQSNGTLGSNPYANSGAGDVEGRTYFLGCFMSESNGSTIFSDAGIQSASEVKATATITAISASPGAYAGGKLVITDTLNNSVTYLLCNGNNGGALSGSPTTGDDANTVGGTAGEVCVQLSAIVNQSDIAQEIQDAINSTLGNNAGTANSVITLSESSGVLTLTQNNPGLIGNKIITRTVITDDAVYTIAGFSGGLGGAVPILRGVLLAASGVALSLSGAFDNEVSQTPLLTTTATTDGSTPRYGQMTGSIKLAGSGEFCLILNGFKGSSARESNVITASFESISDFYFGKEGVFNTDPLAIEEHGHYLYSHYYIHPQLATITGSGVIPAGYNSTYENTGFILTSSYARGETSLSNVPDYEDWQDRFSYAESPYIISQDNQNLFKLVALSPGSEYSANYKFSITNLDPTAKTFSLSIRSLSDSDSDPVILAGPWNNLSLDPNSENYIARILGDMNTRFDFENTDEEQKIVIEGTHPIRNNYVRVVVSNELANGNISSNAIPFGFRGIMHTVTSGSLMASYEGNFSDADILKRIIEPPVPFRENINETGGIASTKFFWGYQNEVKINISDINNFGNGVVNSNIAYTKHYPTHRTDTTPFAVKANEGAANVNGSVLDCDLFNKNKFSLSNIKIRTGSNELADIDHWSTASYVRGGGITADDVLKTRALQVNDLTYANNKEYIKFTCLFQGGWDGVDIFNEDKALFKNDAVKREYDNVNDLGGVKNGPTIKAYRKGLSILGSKSDVDIQLLANPGIRHSAVIDYGISVAENRFDTLYIIDIEQYDSLGNAITGSNGDVPSILKTVEQFKSRNLNTSFAAAYFPDVNIDIDINGVSTSKLVPPTVAVLGAYANNDAIGNSWFAPAGNTRGKLSAQSTTLGTITRTNLDILYEADINPIQVTINNGVTIQGQKTLLKNLSALDRVNVRRLLITVRRAVRNIANVLIFEPNRPETLNKFRSLVNPILESLKTQQGIARYKVVIDETTTTQADVENNTIRGKIYLQPVRVAEFIALDFNITNNIVD